MVVGVEDDAIRVVLLQLERVKAVANLCYKTDTHEHDVFRRLLRLNRC